MADEKKAKVKRPTAAKRLLQNEKKRLKNRIFKTKVRSAVRTFEAALKEDQKEQIQENLKAVHSLMDKGVCRGIFKKNKTARTKSRFAARAR